MCFYTTSTLIRIPLTALSLWKHIQLFPSVIFKPPTLEIPHLTGRLPRHKPVFESGAQGLVLPLLEHIKSREFVILQPRYPSSKGFSPLHLENTWSLHFSFLCYSHSLCWHTAFDYQTAVILFFFFFFKYIWQAVWGDACRCIYPRPYAPECSHLPHYLSLSDWRKNLLLQF